MRPVAALSKYRQEEASRLYKSGLSAQEVADTLGVSLNATFYALRSLKVTRRTAQESNRIRFESQPLSYSVKTNLSSQEEQLKLAAVMLYWAEGYKVGRIVDFANSDPGTVLIFRRFLTDICRVDESRLRGHLYCYEGQDVPAIRHYWSKLLNIPEERFCKPYIKASAPGPRGPRMTRGLVHIRYCDKKLLKQILDWIDEYQAICVGGRVVNYTTL